MQKKLLILNLTGSEIPHRYAPDFDHVLDFNLAGFTCCERWLIRPALISLGLGKQEKNGVGILADLLSHRKKVKL